VSELGWENVAYWEHDPILDMNQFNTTVNAMLVFFGGFVYAIRGEGIRAT
jgi:hypothetical protein